MGCSGKFTGRYLVLSDLGIKIDFKPVDVIMFGTGPLERFITYSAKDRSSLVFFTRREIWDTTVPFECTR